MHTCTATTVDQLLSLRDAEPIEAYVVQHVNTCAACSRELERLRNVRSALQALPAFVAPPYAPTPRAQLTQRDKRRFHTAGVASAAASIAAIAALIVFARHPDRNDMTRELSVRAVPTETETVTEPAIASLVTRSQNLESRLRRMPARPIVERASTSTTIDSLQSSIQWVDYQLSLANDAGLSERQAMQLWQDRIQLMDSLVKVRYAEAQRFAVLQ